MTANTASRSMPRRFRTRLLPPLLALGLAACGGGAELLVIPLFQFGFSGTTGGVPVQAFFGPDVPTTNTGSFDFVNINIGATQSRYVGTWANCGFRIALDVGQTVQPPGAASYDGRFTGNDSIELAPTSGDRLPTLQLTRQGVVGRQIGC